MIYIDITAPHFFSNIIKLIIELVQIINNKTNIL
jgi:hypothetical protein